MVRRSLAAASHHKVLLKTPRAKIRLSPSRIYRDTRFVGRNVTAAYMRPKITLPEMQRSWVAWSSQRRPPVTAIGFISSLGIQSGSAPTAVKANYCSLRPSRLAKQAWSNPVRSCCIFSSALLPLPIAADLASRYALFSAMSTAVPCLSSICHNQRSIKSIVSRSTIDI